jgi:hypothetical protein
VPTLVMHGEDNQAVPIKDPPLATRLGEFLEQPLALKDDYVPAHSVGSYKLISAPKSQK